MSVKRWSKCNTTSSTSVNGSVLTCQVHTAASVHVDTHGIKMDTNARVRSCNSKEINTSINIKNSCISGTAKKAERISDYFVCPVSFFPPRYRWMYAEEWGMLPRMHKPQRWLQMCLSWKLPSLSLQQKEVWASLKFTKDRLLAHSSTVLLFTYSSTLSDIRERWDLKVVFWSKIFVSKVKNKRNKVNYFIVPKSTPSRRVILANFKEVDSHLSFWKCVYLWYI